MTSARVDHTATLLQNGKILVAGGFSSGWNAVSTAELYDPASGTWTPTGSMNTARADHTATLLQNGKVLVAGGQHTNDPLATAELYDPVSGSWTLTGSLNVARVYSKATLLSNGKVLISGGNSGDNSSIVPSHPITSTAELYDPQTGSWTLTGALNEARANHTATLLQDGRVLAAGGGGNPTYYSNYDSSNPTLFTYDSTLSSMEIYDPSAGTWTPTGSLMQKRMYHTATLLPNGLVMLAGGMDNNETPTSTCFSSVELYDPVAGVSTSAAAMSTARVKHTATLLPNGSVLVIGGETNASLNLANSAELYDPSTGSWSITNSLNTFCFLQTATLLPSGSILVAGGVTNDAVTPTTATSNTELYDATVGPSTGSWAYTGSMNNALPNSTLTLLSNGQVLAVGGQYAELYNPLTGTWANTGSMNSNRQSYISTTLLPNGKVLLIGGLFEHPVTEIYDPATGTWATNALPAGVNETATLLRNGKVLIAGYSFLPGITGLLYDPRSDTWSTTGSMITPRQNHKAVLLPNGKVLVVGGWDNFTDIYSAELYDPATGEWTAAGASTVAAYTCITAALLPNGKVLATGVNSAPAADLFDPLTGTWTSATPPKAAHGPFPALIVLPTGKALLLGGGTSELYDPSTDQWTPTANMNVNRENNGTTLLPDGRVLVAGGDYYGNALSSTEVYDVGLTSNNSWRPQIASITSPLNLGAALTLTGSGFRGISGASGGNGQDSPTDYPLVQLRNIQSGQATFLLASNWSTNSFTSLPVWNFPPGQALATVFVNGISSTSSIVNITVPTPAVTMLSNPQRLANGSFQFSFTNNPGAVFGLLASTNCTLPLTNWTALSGVMELSPGQFQFTDPQATNSQQCFYQLFAP